MNLFDIHSQSVTVSPQAITTSKGILSSFISLILISLIIVGVPTPRSLIM
jgi:hypothetical protein